MTVENGKIANIRIVARDKQDRFNKIASQANATYGGKRASVSTIVDETSSASLSGGSSKAKYTVNLTEAMQTALSSAPAQDEDDGDSSEKTLASAGVYTGTATMANGQYITLNVTVDNDGKISNLTIADAGGNWDSLLANVKSDYVGTDADLSKGSDNAIDAVTTATSKGYREAIANAIKNALSNGPSSSDDPNIPDPQPQEEGKTTTYSSGTNQAVSGVKFTGPVYVESGAVIRFDDCWFPYGIELQDASATAIVTNSYFGTSAFYIPIVSNVVGDIQENTVVTQESGVAASFPITVSNSGDTSADTEARLHESALRTTPDWANGNEQNFRSNGKQFRGYYLTGTTPDVEENTYQSFNTYLKYVDESGQAADNSELEVLIPVVMTITPQTTPNTDTSIVVPGDGGVERDKDDSLEVSKGANVTNVLPDNTFTLTLEANATGSTTSSESTGSGAANILLVLDNTASMQTRYGDGTRLSTMKQAAVDFVNNLPESNESKIAMMSFRLGNYTSPTTTNVEWSELGTGSKQTVIAAINELNAPSMSGYDTSFITPLNAATSYVGAVGNENPTYVVFFTDGSDINSQSSVESAAVALHAQAHAVFSVGIVEARYAYDDEAAFRAKAQAIASQSGYYYEVTDAASMNAGFQSALGTIQSEVSQSNTTLDANAVFKDVVNTEKFDVSGATATVTVYDYDSGSWVPLAGAQAAATVGNPGTLNNWTNKSSEDGNLTVNLNADGTVTITGFSYKDHYLPTNNQEAEGVNAQRLHLEISGLKLKDGAQTAADQIDVPTNDEKNSGIFKDSNQTRPIKYFPLPTVNIPGKGGVSTVVNNVGQIQVTKTWADGTEPTDSVEVELYEDGALKDTQTLNAGNQWTYTWENIDEDKTYNVIESKVVKDGKDVTSRYQANITQTSTTITGDPVQGWTARSYGAVQNGKTYVFTYTYSNREYMLSLSGSTVVPKEVKRDGNGVITNATEADQWVVGRTKKGFSLRNVYAQKNRAKNQYLKISDSKVSLDDKAEDLTLPSNGSIGDDDAKYKIVGTSSRISANRSSYTRFTPNEFTETTTTVDKAIYTISNKEKVQTEVYVTLVKTDEEDNPLPGAKFNIYENGSLMDTAAISNENGIVSGTKTENGRYRLWVGHTYSFKEIEAPSGYKGMASDFQIEVTASGIVIPNPGSDITQFGNMKDGYTIYVMNHAETPTIVTGVDLGGTTSAIILLSAIAGLGILFYRRKRRKECLNGEGN